MTRNPSVQHSDKSPLALLFRGLKGVVREVRKYPTFHEIVQTNIKKWKYSNTAEFYYRSRRVHR